jgi:hypothetical protein
MAILSRLAVALAVLGGCYSPELRDCTVTCAMATDCAADQVCDPDGYCTAPSAAGTCARIAPIDAAPRDADDTSPPIDAPLPRATLDVRTTGDGGGRIRITGIGVCDSMQDGGDCTFTADANVVLAITAEPHPGARFDKWEGMTCKDQNETCSTVAVAPITFLAAKFRRMPGGGDDD